MPDIKDIKKAADILMAIPCKSTMIYDHATDKVIDLPEAERFGARQRTEYKKAQRIVNMAYSQAVECL